jgi:import inner membrane translocase subunit TIM44
LILVVGCFSNPEFQKSVKELKEKAEELKGVKEGLKER